MVEGHLKRLKMSKGNKSKRTANPNSEAPANVTSCCDVAVILNTTHDGLCRHSDVGPDGRWCGLLKEKGAFVMLDN